MAIVWPMGRVVWIDLTKKEYSFTVLDDADVYDWIGGRGLAAKLLSDQLSPRTDYYSAENPLVFTIGPITGTKSPVNGRFVVATRSPLTGGYGMALSGGSFGPAMRWNGLNAIVISGASETPVSLTLEKEKVVFHDASHLWGRDTFETQDMFKQEIEDPRAEIACIGPAGENLVRFAALIAGRRAAARCGVAAVMGSKKLKAIALTRIPKEDYQVARPDEFKKDVREAYKALAHHPVTKIMRDQGSAFTLAIVNKAGVLPTRNFQQGVFEGAEKISGERLRDEFRVRKTASCYRCPVGCESEVRVDKGEYAGAHTRGLEYETMYALGSNCGNSSMESLIFLDMHCDMLGIDTMSLGVTVAFAMECYEKGLITKADTDGLDLTWGNHQAIRQLADLIVARKGIGNVLADGVAMASTKIPGSENYAMHVKGLEMGGYDPRGAKGQGLSFATSPRGGCHHNGGYIVGPEILAGTVDRFSTEGKAALVKGCRNSRIIYDSMILCTFCTGALGWSFPARLLSSALGKDFSENDLHAVADRIADLERSINRRFGIKAKDDTLPQRFLKEPMPDGPSKGNTVALDDMLQEFYKLNMWENN